MNIRKIATEETHFDEPVECKIFDKGQLEVDSQGCPVVFNVVSEYSAARRIVDQQQKEKLSKLGRRYGSWTAIPQAETDALADEKIAACISGWSGVESDGQPFPYSPANAIALVAALRQYRPKTLQQILGAIDEHAAFFTTASAS